MNSFVGVVGKEISKYAVIKEINRFYKTFVYAIVDDDGNTMIWETDKLINSADGKHYFLVEGTVKEHKESWREKQTILSDCDLEFVGKLSNIKGAFCASVGDEVGFDNITVRFRKAYDTEWISNGYLTVLAPVSEYRLVFDYGHHTFLIPFDSAKRLTFKDTGKFNLIAKIIGYRLEKNIKSTFLYPLVLEDKNGALYPSKPRFYGIR